MLNRLPRHMPPLWLMLDDIGQPSPAELARALGVTERTVSRWLKAGQAPHAAMLALFWITRWGQSVVNADAQNQAVTSAGLARSRMEQIEALKGQLQRLGRIAQFGSANDPAPDVHTDAAMSAAIVIKGENHDQPSGSTVEHRRVNQASHRADHREKPELDQASPSSATLHDRLNA